MEQENKQNSQPQEAKKRVGDIVALVIMIVLSVLLIPVFVINLTLIIKGSVNPDVPPDVFGVAPLAVTSGSMDGDREGSFPQGALIFVRILDDEEKQALETDDVITFRSSDNVYVTHRIVSVNRDDAGKVVSFVTRGDANASTDGAIPVENVVGICTGSVNGLGDFAIFLQTPVGIIVFIGIPVVLFIIYDVTRITLYNRKAKREAAQAAEGESGSELENARNELRDKEEELARLRAQLAAQQSAQPSEGQDDTPDEK